MFIFNYEYSSHPDYFKVILLPHPVKHYIVFHSKAKLHITGYSANYEGFYFSIMINILDGILTNCELKYILHFNNCEIDIKQKKRKNMVPFVNVSIYFNKYV
uniref:Uncharacterized protein n=1 Tax=Octopus bimaculoides TaxID=37653 RepID=A0A0L8GTF8_OCTBM